MHFQACTKELGHASDVCTQDSDSKSEIRDSNSLHVAVPSSIDAAISSISRLLRPFAILRNWRSAKSMARMARLTVGMFTPSCLN